MHSDSGLHTYYIHTRFSLLGAVIFDIWFMHVHNISFIIDFSAGLVDVFGSELSLSIQGLQK